MRARNIRVCHRHRRLEQSPADARRMLIAIERYGNVWRRYRKIAQNDVGCGCRQQRLPCILMSYRHRADHTRRHWAKRGTSQRRGWREIDEIRSVPERGFTSLKEVAIVIPALWCTTLLVFSIFRLQILISKSSGVWYIRDNVISL